MGEKQPKRIFVVGATGYIGRFVVRELVGRGHEVVSFAPFFILRRFQSQPSGTEISRLYGGRENSSTIFRNSK